MNKLFVPGHRRHARYQAAFHDRHRFGDLSTFDENRKAASYLEETNPILLHAGSAAHILISVR